CGKLSHRNKSLSNNVLQLYYNGFIPFCVYTTYFTLPPIFIYKVFNIKKKIHQYSNALKLLDSLKDTF
ncbi:hypothetical protein ACXONP_09565, partial [Streptococcus thermophilus]